VFGSEPPGSELSQAVQFEEAPRVANRPHKTFVHITAHLLTTFATSSTGDDVFDHLPNQVVLSIAL
jgi:hypothetical protein